MYWKKIHVRDAPIIIERQKYTVASPLSASNESEVHSVNFEGSRALAGRFHTIVVLGVIQMLLSLAKCSYTVNQTSKIAYSISITPVVRVYRFGVGGERKAYDFRTIVRGRAEVSKS